MVISLGEPCKYEYCFNHQPPQFCSPVANENVVKNGATAMKIGKENICPDQKQIG